MFAYRYVQGHAALVLLEHANITAMSGYDVMSLDAIVSRSVKILEFLVMATISTSNDNVPKGPGRPSSFSAAKQSLVVSIHFPERHVCNEDVVHEFNAHNSWSLQVPNQLLFSWYQDKISADHYLSLVNAAILYHIVRLKLVNPDLEQKLYKRAGTVYGIGRKKTGRARMKFLQQNSSISLTCHDLVQVT